MISTAYKNFMHSRQELSDFSTFYHKIAKQAIQPNETTTDEDLYKEYRGYSIFFMENYIVKISDLFDIYLDDLVYAITLVKKDFLPNREYVKAKSRLVRLGFPNHADEDVLFEAAVTFGRKDKIEIADHFKSSIGFDIVSASEHWQDVLLCSKIRNLIVHKASVIDERFVEFVKNSDLPFEVAVGAPLLMPEKWILQLAKRVDHCISRIDESIDDFVPIEKTSRFGHFWLPRSVWANPLTEDTTT